MSDRTDVLKPEVRWPRWVLVVVGVLAAGVVVTRLVLPGDPAVRILVAWVVALVPPMILILPAGARGVAYGACVGLAALLLSELAAGLLPRSSRDWTTFLAGAALYVAFALGALTGVRFRDRAWTRDPARRSRLGRLLSRWGRKGDRAEGRRKEPGESDRSSVLLSEERFEERLFDLLRRANGAEEPLSVIAVEVEGLDRHPEELRREVWKAVEDQLEEGHELGSIGGDRCAAILPGATTGAASVVAERIRANVAPLSPDKGGPLVVSAGVAAVERGGDARPSASVAAAEAALEQAKRLGGDRVMVRDGGVYREGPLRPAFGG